MTNTITSANLRNMFATWVESATKAGALTEHQNANREIRLVTGSKYYGNSFGVVAVDPKTGGQQTMVHLGFTKREAWTILAAQNRAWYASAQGSF